MKSNMIKLLAVAVGIILCLAVVIAVIYPQHVTAAEPAELVQQAKDSLALGKYDDAAKLYRQAYDQGATGADMCYNIGTAYLRAGKLGQGVLFLERAAALEPDDPDVQANLAWAHENIRHTAATRESKEEATDGEGITLTGLVGRLSLNTWGLLFVGGFWALAAVLVLLLFSAREKRKVLSLITAGLFVWTGLFGGLFWLKTQEETPHRWGIVMSRVEAKEGPNERFETVFDVAEGVKVEIKDSIDDWSEVRLPNGLHGYVPSSQCKHI